MKVQTHRQTGPRLGAFLPLRSNPGFALFGRFAPLFGVLRFKPAPYESMAWSGAFKLFEEVDNETAK